MVSLDPSGTPRGGEFRYLVIAGNLLKSRLRVRPRVELPGCVVAHFDNRHNLRRFINTVVHQRPEWQTSSDMTVSTTTRGPEQPLVIPRGHTLLEVALGGTPQEPRLTLHLAIRPERSVQPDVTQLLLDF